MRAKIIAAGVIGLLCGCATQAQRQFETISANLKTADAERSSCVAAVYNSPDAAPLRVHRPLNLHDLTLEQLADSSKATDEEVSAILTTHPRFQECRRAYLAALSGSVPSLVPIYVEAYNKVDDNLLALIQQRIVWGDWLKQERDRAGATQAAVQAEGQRIGQGLNQEHQAAGAPAEGGRRDGAVGADPAANQRYEPPGAHVLRYAPYDHKLAKLHVESGWQHGFYELQLTNAACGSDWSF